MSRVLRLLFLVLVIAAPAAGQVVGPPYVFQAGTVISPDEINISFSTIYDNALNRTGGTMTGTLTGVSATFSGTLGVTGATTLGSTLGVTGATTLAALSATTGTFSSTLGVTGIATFTAATAFNSTSAAAIDVAGGITAGSGNVAIIDTTGKIPAISSTYFANLSGTNLTGVAKVASTETISGSWTFTSDLRISAAVPSIRITETDQAADAKQWQLASSGSVFGLFAVNDAESGGTQAIGVSRSGSSVTGITMHAAVTLNEFMVLNSKTHALLGGGGDGTILYCSDCNRSSSPCTSGGTGALAVQINGSFVCH